VRPRIDAHQPADLKKRSPMDAHQPADMSKRPSPMDAHKRPDMSKQPSPMDAHKPPDMTPGIGSGGATTGSRFRAVGRFLAREAPGLALQLVFMMIFPPGVIKRQDRLVVLSATKINPAAMDALVKQQAVFDKLFADDPAKTIYANFSVRLDYSVDASRGGDLLLDLTDMTLVDVKITTDNISSDPKKMNQTGSRLVSKQITYSMRLYEPENAARVREWQEALQKYQECLQQPGAGQGAGAEPYSHCIPPRMKPIKYAAPSTTEVRAPSIAIRGAAQSPGVVVTISSAIFASHRGSIGASCNAGVAVHSLTQRTDSAHCLSLWG
jgi:hypothetical protein